MKITTITIGKPIAGSQFGAAIAEYEARIKHFCVFEWLQIKGANQGEPRITETKVILSKLGPSDYVILLDETGYPTSSKQLANLLDGAMQTSIGHVVFVIGGAHGVSQDMFTRAQKVISIASGTYPHELVRVMLVEQLYRSFAILNNHPYHHE